MSYSKKMQNAATRLGMLGGGAFLGYSFLEPIITPLIPLAITLAASLTLGLSIKAIFTAACNRKLNQTYRYTQSAPRQSAKPTHEAPRKHATDQIPPREPPPPPPPPDALALYRNLMGLRPNFTPDELKAAYRAAAARYHPDRYAAASQRDHDNAEILMKQINEAYEKLKAPC